MQISNPELRTEFDARRLPAFTLGTALAWSGHECKTCPILATEQRARMWLIDAPTGDTSVGMRTFIDVEFLDPAWSPDESIALMKGVNACTGRDRIQVQERSAAERLAIDTLSAWLAHAGAQRVPVPRKMKPTGSDRFTVPDEAGTILATEVAFDAAHEFVHAGCVLCAEGERHINETVRHAPV